MESWICSTSNLYLWSFLLLEVLLSDVPPQLGPLARHEGALLAVVRWRDVVHLESILSQISNCEII